MYIIELRKIFENELGDLNSVIYIYDKVIIFSIPIRNHVVVISSDKNIDIDSDFKRVQSFIKNSETELDLEFRCQNIGRDEKEVSRICTILEYLKR
ncbi:MAG: hypothetical protein ABR515_02755 [Nitrososphaeraceae archaeon]